VDAWAALDAFLLIEHNINYWEDDAVDHALELLEALDDAGRDALEAARVDRQPSWRRQLASALCGDESAAGRATLASMLSDPDIAVALEAAESLEGRDDLPLPDGLQPTLRALRERSTSPDRVTIDALLTRA